MYAATICRASFVLMTPLLFLMCSSTPDSTPLETASTIHEAALVIDAHAHAKPGAAETLNFGEKTEWYCQLERDSSENG